MEMDKESVRELTESITDMARNILIDDAFPTVLAVTVKCNNCGDFHMYTYLMPDLLNSMPIPAMIGAMLFGPSGSLGDSIAGIMRNACKNLGASLAADNKEVLSATMLACGGTIDIDESVDMKSKSMDEIIEYISEHTDETDIKPNMTVATFAVPDMYHEVIFKVELLDNNDMLLKDKKEKYDAPAAGNFYDAHKAVLESARLLKGVRIAACGEEAKADTPLSPENEEKFRLFLSKIARSLKATDVI